MRKIHVLIIVATFVIFAYLSYFQLFGIFMWEVRGIPDGMTQEVYEKSQIISTLIRNWVLAIVVSWFFITITNYIIKNTKK